MTAASENPVKGGLTALVPISLLGSCGIAGMRHDQNVVSPLRARVIAVLEQAGYRNSEDSLPVPGSGGTFSATGGNVGVNVTWRRWDASEDELGELRVGIAAALRAAGLDVHELGRRIFVPGGGLEDAEPGTDYPAPARAFYMQLARSTL